MSTVTDNTGKLDAFVATLSAFAGRKIVMPDGLPEAVRIKLEHLRATGRDFFQETPGLKAAIVAAIRAKLTGGRINAADWDEAVAEAVKAFVLARFQSGGGDVSLAPLSPMYRAYKAAVGLDPRIGIATGLLFGALSRARWIVRRAS